MGVECRGNRSVDPTRNMYPRKNEARQKRFRKRAPIYQTQKIKFKIQHRQGDITRASDILRAYKRILLRNQERRKPKQKTDTAKLLYCRLVLPLARKKRQQCCHIVATEVNTAKPSIRTTVARHVISLQQTTRGYSWLDYRPPRNPLLTGTSNQIHTKKKQATSAPQK